MKRKHKTPQSPLQNALANYVRHAMIERGVGYLKLAALTNLDYAHLAHTIGPSKTRDVSVDNLVLCLSVLGYNCVLHISERKDYVDEFTHRPINQWPPVLPISKNSNVQIRVVD